MTYFKKFLSDFFILTTILSFVVSTTGFTSYTHHCQHHDAQKSLAQNDESCCSTSEKINIEESCCKPSTCQTNGNHSTCCSDEVSYYRLSEWFTPPDSEKKQLVSQKIILLPFKIAPDETQLIDNQHQFDHDQGPIHKIPIYILFSQTKLDPHLI